MLDIKCRTYYYIFVKFTSKKDRKVTVRLSARDYERLQNLLQGESISAFIRSALHSEIAYEEIRRRKEHMEIIEKIYESDNKKEEQVFKKLRDKRNNEN